MSSDPSSSAVERKSSAILAAKLTKDLIDENLMQRYGTSLDINMGREYQKYLDKKYHDLKEEFNKINKDQDDYVSLEELTEFINSYSQETGKVYEAEYSKKLFDLIDRDKDQHLTIQEFIEAYIKLEERLRLKKIKLTKLDDELRATKEKYLKGMNENKGEKLTNEGISENATLYISLLDAKELKPMDYNGQSDPYVIFTLGDKKATSSYKPETLDPVWNEDFSFPVTKKDMVLEVQVWDRDTFGGDDLEGTVRIPLKDLEDQLKTEREYDLILNDEISGNGTIRLRLHYVFSRYKYFSDNYNKTELQILRLQEDINELNRYLELYGKPFGILLYGEINNIIDKRILERSEDASAYAASARRSIYVQSPQNKIKAGLALRVENVIKGISKRGNIEWSKLSLVLMYLIVISSCVCLIERSDFVGLFVGVAIWILFIWEKKIDVLEYLRYLLFTILVTVFYDFFWLYLHYSSYWKGSAYDRQENALKGFTYFLSFVNFVSKIMLLVMLWIQYNKAFLSKNKNVQRQPTNQSKVTASAMVNIGDTYQP